MKNLLVFAVIIAFLSLGDAYSKYGRSCKDIGCARNEVCVMQEDPCSVYSRDNCGKYPTCKKISEAAATCANYVCPPTKMCRVDRGEPKCIDDPAAAVSRENKQTVQSYNPGSPGGDAPAYPPQANYPQNPSHSNNYPSNPAYNPNYPQNPGVYPQIPGQTTPRPNVYQHGQTGGRGYQGGAVGSGYPGQAGYPAQGGRVPQQQYPGQQYPGQQYPGQQYPGQQYPGQQYPGQQYPGGYNNQQGGNYPRQGAGYNQNQRYGKPNGGPSSNPLTDKIVDTLKTLGLFWFLVKYTVSRFYGIE